MNIIAIFPLIDPNYLYFLKLCAILGCLKKIFLFPIYLFFIVNSMEKYSHTQKSAQNVDK